MRPVQLDCACREALFAMGGAKKKSLTPVRSGAKGHAWLPKSQANLRDHSSIKSQGRGRDVYTDEFSTVWSSPSLCRLVLCIQSLFTAPWEVLLIRFLSRWFLLEKSQYVARCHQPTYNEPCLTHCAQISTCSGAGAGPRGSISRAKIASCWACLQSADS